MNILTVTYRNFCLFFLCTHEALQSRGNSRNKKSVMCTVISISFPEVRSHVPCWTSLSLYEFFYFTAQCKQGTYSSNGLETCETCPLGTYQPAFGSRNCISCPEDTTTVKRGTVDVSACGGV